MTVRQKRAQREAPHGCVLAGGASTRMGKAKAFLEVGGLSLLERAVRCVAATAGEVSIVGLADLPGSPIPCFPDLLRGRGPLAGIQTGLRIAASDPVLFCPCDCPLLPPAIFRILLDRLESRLAAVPVDSRGRLHPLIGVYRQDCLQLLDARLQAGRLAVMGLLDDLQDRLVLVEVASLGIPDQAFLNVNTPESLAEARLAIQ